MSIAAQALEMLARIPGEGQGTHWPDMDTKRAAFALHEKATGKRLKGNCPTCSTTVIDWLRSFASLPPLGKAASTRLHEKRLAICRGVNEDGSDACESLSWPGLNCAECLCFVDVKARLKKSKCPKGKW